MTATLRFDVVSNGAAARRDLSSTRGEVERFGKSTDKLGSQTERSRSRVGRFGSSVAGMAKSFGPLAVAVAGAAIVKFGVDAVKTASQTQQAFGSVDAVFGRNAAKVKAWSESAATDVGLARGEYAELAATLGATLKNSGVENFTGKTRGLIKTAADMAATFGGSTKDAVEALGSALRGETDPIERYGVSIKQSDVNTLLAARGQAKLTGAAGKAAAQQARLDLITKQTTISQGAFKRETNTLAGQQQRLSAQFTNVKDRLGSALIPALTRGLTAVNGLFSGSGRLSSISRALGSIYRSYLTPIIAAARGAVDKCKQAFADAGGKGDGLKKIIKLIGDVAKFAAPIMGKTLGGAITGLAKIAGGTLAAIDNLATGISNVVTWAQRAWDKLGALADKARSIGSLGGLLRTGDPSQLGLARASGLGMVGGFGQAPRINLTSSPSVVVDIDSPALARLFRVVVRDELKSLGYSGGRTP